MAAVAAVASWIAVVRWPIAAARPTAAVAVIVATAVIVAVAAIVAAVARFAVVAAVTSPPAAVKSLRLAALRLPRAALVKSARPFRLRLRLATFPRPRPLPTVSRPKAGIASSTGMHKMRKIGLRSRGPIFLFLPPVAVAQSLRRFLGFDHLAGRWCAEQEDGSTFGRDASSCARPQACCASPRSILAWHPLPPIQRRLRRAKPLPWCSRWCRSC